MSFYNTVQKINGIYTFPRIGANFYNPLRVTDLRDPRIKEAIAEIKKELPDPESHNHLLQIWGYVDRDSKGNYAKVPEEYSVIENDEEIEAKKNFEELVKSSKQFTIDPNYVNADAIAELLRSLPRNRQYLISQGSTTFTMNDKVRNNIVHLLIAHQSISETSSEKWIESAVSGGVPFTISEHTYVKEGGYQFQDPAFFNHLFKTDVDDDFVKLFEIFQIFKQLPDFTKYTDAGVDNDNHFGEHYMQPRRPHCPSRVHTIAELLGRPGWGIS